eukprot:CAMPEP_0167744450 /NCGR_PEP_ID=MMETSP0110_2-20121227/2599_1 /TAXON_ID=629695 /ORGANISM="Gymnochlora sp., Strain CCMP2014" /LENGTH=549 /DNA_ID=CAMNT_0007628975 /DNA_START=35 /DNA_END=1682 /DNA_ORIENTATION=+
MSALSDRPVNVALGAESAESSSSATKDLKKRKSDNACETSSKKLKKELKLKKKLEDELEGKEDWGMLWTRGLGDIGPPEYETEDWDEDKWTEYGGKFSAKELKEKLRYFIIRGDLDYLNETATATSRAILSADPRNDPDDCFLMFNTWTSNCMHRVILKTLRKANSLVSSARKGGGAEKKKALLFAIAITLSIKREDHWYLDTDDPESCTKIAKAFSRMWTGILGFSNTDMNIDANDREGIFQLIENLNESFGTTKYIEDFQVKYKTKKNCQWEFQRTILARQAMPSSTSSTNSSSGFLSYVSSLNGLRLKARLDSVVQLRLTHKISEKKEIEKFLIVPASYTLWKLNQTISFCYDETSLFVQKTQQGKTLPGSYFEVKDAKDCKTIFASKKDCKQIGSSALHDKDYKLAQIIQGCTSTSTSGMKWDSIEAKEIADNIFFVGSTGIRISVQPMCLISKKTGKPKHPLPRLVGYNPKDISKKGNRQKNKIMCDGRKSHVGWIMVTNAERKKLNDEARFAPLCRKDGSTKDFGHSKYLDYSKVPIYHTMQN